MRHAVSVSIAFAPTHHETRHRGAADSAPEPPAAGLREIIAGLAFAVVGVVIFCTLGLNSPPASGSAAAAILRWPLGVIALGALVWLVGAMRYIREALSPVESDQQG